MKKSGWINIYWGTVCQKAMSCGTIYKTEEEAKNNIYSMFEYLDTIKIEWNEKD